MIVLSYAAWQRRFQGDAGIVGQTVQLNGTAFTVIGIAPETFTGTSVLAMAPDFWAPVSMQAQLAPGSNWLDAPDDHQLQILGRLKDGVPVQPRSGRGRAPDPAVRLRPTRSAIRRCG